MPRAAPPYYEGIAIVGNYTIVEASTCHWNAIPKLTLTEVNRTVGLCIGQPTGPQASLCNKTIPTSKIQGPYIVPPKDSWWACTTGLTPRVTIEVLKRIERGGCFCAMVQIIPRIYFHPAGTLENSYSSHPTHFKREHVTLTLAALLGFGVAVGVGTGTAALIREKQHYSTLQAAVDEGLRALEQSVSKLAQSFTSLSEVVLQNRRGLDLLFLKESGLCVALGEECCFYVDNSGVVRDSMGKLRTRLDKRQKDREAQQGWFEGWFNRSPWVTTLLSAIMGPLVILLLLLTFGPCILKMILQFIRGRLSIVQSLVLTQQYQALKVTE